MTINVTVLASGRGSNFKALLANQEAFHIKALVSNKRDAFALTIARDAAVSTACTTREEHQSLAAFKAAILAAVQSTKPDIVALAGFMMVLQPEFIAAFPSRIVNIHPSLLPKYPGLHTHERAIAAGESVHGCSVHIVDAGVDTGPLISQATVKVLPGDTPDELAARVLEREHVVYPWVLNRIGSGDISLGPTVRYSDRARTEAEDLGLTLPSHGSGKLA
jgi:phosphoribosylglycinamide formyltransferase-1